MVGTAGGAPGVTLIAVAWPGIGGGPEGVTPMARGGGGPAIVTLMGRATGMGGGGRAWASVTVPSPWYMSSTPPRWMVWPACRGASLTGARLM